MKRFVVMLICLFVLSCAGLSIGLVDFFFLNDQFDSEMVAGPAFEIHAEAWKESHFGLSAPGGIYEYRCVDRSTGVSSSILSFRYSHPDPIPAGQIIIVDSNVAYFWHEFVFAVTVDAGQTWSVRGNPDRSLDTLYLWTHPRITNVTIAADGTGLMSVEPYVWQSISFGAQRTDDFGETWVPVLEASEDGPLSPD